MASDREQVGMVEKMLLQQYPDVAEKGVFTPDLIDAMDSARLAFILNAMMVRSNIDPKREARRRAVGAVLGIAVVSAGVGALVTFIAIGLFANPIVHAIKDAIATREALQREAIYNSLERNPR